MTKNDPSVTVMTSKKFEQTYCMMCGSQRCGGISDAEFRGGCPHYQSYIAVMGIHHRKANPKDD